MFLESFSARRNYRAGITAWRKRKKVGNGLTGVGEPRARVSAMHIAGYYCANAIGPSHGRTVLRIKEITCRGLRAKLSRHTVYMVLRLGVSCTRRHFRACEQIDFSDAARFVQWRSRKAPREAAALLVDTRRR